MDDKIRIKRALILGLGIIVLIAFIFLAGKVGSKDKLEVTNESVIETEIALMDGSKVACRFIDMQSGEVYKVGEVRNVYYVFRDEENLGRSSYSLASDRCSFPEDDIKEFKDDDILENYADDSVYGLYHLEKNRAFGYVKYLLENKHELLYELDAGSFNEFILKRNDKFVRLLVANDRLILEELGDSCKFDSEYYLKQYIY